MKKALTHLSCAVFLFAFIFLAGSLPLAAAENPSRITVIDNASRVKLANSTHVLVASAKDVGRADPSLRMERMLLVLGPADEMQPALHALIDSLHDKKSSNIISGLRRSSLASVLALPRPTFPK
jgi:hypothetical protein